MHFSPYGLLLLTQPLQSSEQHIRANLEFSSNFAVDLGRSFMEVPWKGGWQKKNSITLEVGEETNFCHIDF